MKGIEITLPVIKRSKITGKKIKRSYKDEKFMMDLSLAVQARFETKFPKESQEYGDLVLFSERVRAELEKGASKSTIISMLKCIYCWFDTKYSYIEFLQLFDITDIDYLQKLVDKLKLTFNIIFENASEKN